MIKIYSSNWCSYCNAAKNLLKELKLEYEEINIEEHNISRKTLEKLTGGYTLPQISIHGKFIGGYDVLQNLHQNDELMELINNE